MGFGRVGCGVCNCTDCRFSVFCFVLSKQLGVTIVIPGVVRHL